MSELQPHQQRVVDEKNELDSRLEKLESFFDTPIYAGLDKDERLRLLKQSIVMNQYLDILEERIAAFGVQSC